jgi:hypothetical protein
MLSPGVLQMLDQVRSEFGVEVEVVDANLGGTLVPDASPRVLAGAELRSLGIGVLREGRPTSVTIEGRQYRLVPLRNQRSLSPAALMAMRVAGGGMERTAGLRSGGFLHSPEDAESWIEVLRSAIEADLSNRDEIDGERQQARAVRGALRFVTYLAAATSPREVTEAAIQAAAVWFDADARVYRRRPGGGFALVASLPGADIPPALRHVSELALGIDAPFTRSTPVSGVIGGREGMLVPMVGSGPLDWALVLFGPVPAEAEVTLEALGRVLGVQMERLALASAAESRTRFEGLLVRAERPVELVALDLLRELVSGTGGSGAALWVQHGTEVRRMAAVGEGVGRADVPLPDEQQSLPKRQVRSLDLGPNRRARLELSAGSDSPFDWEAPLVVDGLVSVLRAWLPAAVRPAPEVSPALSPAAVADFARRIEEELARAKRFERDLALVVVESGALPSQDTVERLVHVVRSELRGSDVLGLVGERRVVVLLIETHQSAVGTVVRRLRDRLGRAIPDLKVPALVLGQAALSTDCSTADALLSQAAVNAETITVPA